MEVPLSFALWAQEALHAYDGSHDYNHSLRVLGNAQRIVNELCRAGEIFDAIEYKILMCACMVHDVIDHKYAQTQTTSREELMIALKTQLDGEFATVCMHIIENISWSKQQRGLNKPLPTRDILRQIVQCADWMDALGDVGIIRCATFARERGTPPDEIRAAVAAHIDEKLAHVWGALPLEVARDLARSAHEETMRHRMGFEKN